MLDGYFEDLEIGATDTFGEYTVERSEMIEFAEQYDPQPFHTDETAARDSMFGTLVASGWHTAAVTMRLLVDHLLADSRAMGAVGVNELRWNAPVTPGMTLSLETRIADKEPWDDDTGLVHAHTETRAGETTVMTMVGLVLFERRQPPAADR